MELDTAIKGIGKELQQQLTNVTVEEFARVLISLRMMYSIGFNEGRKYPAHCKKIEMLNQNKIFIKEFLSITDAANFLQVNKSAVSKAIKKGNKCKGFYFKIKNQF